MALVAFQILQCSFALLLGVCATSATRSGRDVLMIDVVALESHIESHLSLWVWNVHLQPSNFLNLIQCLGLSCLLSFHIYLQYIGASTFLNMGFIYPDEKPLMIVNEAGVTIDLSSENMDSPASSDGGTSPNGNVGVDISLEDFEPEVRGMAADDELKRQSGEGTRA